MGQECKGITMKKYFIALFRSILYCQYHESLHGSRWVECSSASDDAKLNFFD